MVEVARAGWTTQRVIAALVRAGDELQVAEDDGSITWYTVGRVEAGASGTRHFDIVAAGRWVGARWFWADAELLIRFEGTVPR